MITNITLTDFRSFKKKKLLFSPKVTVIVGPNASGKTNILESLFLLSTGKSFKARIEEEMVNYQAEFARVKSTNPNLEVFLARGENGWPRKKLKSKQHPRFFLFWSGKVMMFTTAPGL